MKGLFLRSSFLLVGLGHKFLDYRKVEVKSSNKSLTIARSTVLWQLHSSTRMWANAQHDGRPAKYRWRRLFNAAKFGWRPLLQCRAVTLPRVAKPVEISWGAQNYRTDLSR